MPFQVTVHEEGAPLTWVTDTTLDYDDETAIVESTEALGRFSQHLELTRSSAKKTAIDLGQRLERLILGNGVGEALADMHPSAVLLGIDETVLNLPWELVGAVVSEFTFGVPLGRVVSARTRPAPRRDPLQEDTVVRILVIRNPTADLDATEAEVAAIESLAGRQRRVEVEVNILSGSDASLAGIGDAVRGGATDILHFAGHGRFDDRRPGTSVLLLADGQELRADDVATLPWGSPPYLVFNSACESGRGAGRRRLVSRTRTTAGLPAAFLAAGVQGYLGHFFPVEDGTAALVSRTFYAALFGLENVGLAVQEARSSVRDRFDEVTDLTCFGLTYFGDAGGVERADLAQSV